MIEPDDLDEENPVDLNADEWLEQYGTSDDFEEYLDHNHDMDF